MKRRLLLITVLAILMVEYKQPIEEVVIDAEVYNNIYELITEAEYLGHIEKVNEIIEEGTHLLVSPDGNFKYTEERENINNCDVYKVHNDELFNYSDYDVLVNGMYFVGKDLNPGKYVVRKYVFASDGSSCCIVYDKQNHKKIYHIGDIIKLKKGMKIQLIDCGIIK